MNPRKDLIEQLELLVSEARNNQWFLAADWLDDAVDELRPYAYPIPSTALEISKPDTCPMCGAKRTVDATGKIECGGEGEGWCFWYQICHAWEVIRGSGPVLDRAALREFVLGEDFEGIMDDQSLDECVQAIVEFYDSVNRKDLSAEQGEMP